MSRTRGANALDLSVCIDAEERQQARMAVEAMRRHGISDATIAEISAGPEDEEVEALWLEETGLALSADRVMAHIRRLVRQ